MKLAIIIPAYNESRTVAKVVKSIPRRIPYVSDLGVIVVNDGSADDTARIAQSAGATVLSHRINLGTGAATVTGIKGAKIQGYQAAVTLDADGQHDPGEIASLVKAHRQTSADLIIGSRFLSDTITAMPKIKKYGNQTMNLITYAFSGLRVTDSQSGFRLFGSRMLEVISFFSTTGYEFCSETIINARQLGLIIHEVPITTIYHQQRVGGQNPLNGVHILLKLIYKALVT